MFFHKENIHFAISNLRDYKMLLLNIIMLQPLWQHVYYIPHRNTPYINMEAASTNHWKDIIQLNVTTKKYKAYLYLNTSSFISIKITMQKMIHHMKCLFMQVTWYLLSLISSHQCPQGESSNNLINCNRHFTAWYFRNNKTILHS
jgi:hypothetical protein